MGRRAGRPEQPGLVITPFNIIKGERGADDYPVPLRF